jgi:hypothetical protein
MWKGYPMKFPAQLLLLLLVSLPPLFADTPEDPYLEALFERLEDAPPPQRHEIRMEIRRYLQGQKRQLRREQLERLRRSCDRMHHGGSRGGRGKGR